MYLFAVIPLALIVIGFVYLNFKQEQLQPTFKLNEVGSCKTIAYNGEGGIDIVFISSEEDAQRYVDVIVSTEPYKTYYNYFNFYNLDDVSAECDLYKDIALLCNTPQVQREARRCPHDYIVAVKDEPSNIRSSSYSNVLSLNRNVEDSVAIHELGHALGNLGEEYTAQNAKLPRGAKNCVATCDAFNGPIDSCNEGCTKETLVRSIDNGVMRTLLTTNYGIYNIELIKKILEKNKPQDSAITGRQVSQSPPSCQDKELIELEIRRDADNNAELTTTNRVLRGCAPDNSGAGDTCIRTNDAQDTCFSFDTVFTDTQTQETIEGETFDPPQVTTVFIEKRPTTQTVQLVTLEGTPLTPVINLAQAGALACLV